ncbi:hypothetical protein V5O48_012112 [Marasmius crinis-equi]|uniref:CxC2-like cysteine cluster KDZ transposase-associated domain-containing protein n=1 Tax=Marasmius crinis-equi TaxID=585013 RepID=A0ABR3F3P4_9AGAR
MASKRRNPWGKSAAKSAANVKRNRTNPAGTSFIDRVDPNLSSWGASGGSEEGMEVSLCMPGEFPVLDGLDPGRKTAAKVKEEGEQNAMVEWEEIESTGRDEEKSKEELAKNLAKPKRTVRSRYPVFLDEVVRHKGRGDYRKQARCSDCKGGDEGDGEAHSRGSGEDAAMGEAGDDRRQARIRCRECFHWDLVCPDCSVRRHWDNPYHHIEEWTGEMFERTSLAEQGLVMQLNHVSGRCSKPVKCYQHLVIIHTNGIHHVNLQFCGCAKAVPQHIQLLRRNLYPTNIKKGRISTVITFQYLESLQIHTLTTKGSIHDFYRAVERLSDNTGLKRLRPRYCQLLRGIRQWRHLKLLLRAGKGQAEISALEEEEEGALTLRCPTCPHPQINLPKDWEAEAWGPRGLCLCLDANFRLKEQLVSSHSRDPALCDGLGYFVRRALFEKWLEENKKVEDSEDEISNCVPFAALTKQNSKFSRGLRYTGVAGVVCGRTDMIVKVANLNKGERFSIIDYVLGVAMQWWAAILWLLLCYDIACQYFRNFARRQSCWPSHISLPPLMQMVVAIGKLHHPGHNSECHEELDLNLRPGAAQIDGESCERFWSNHNALSNSTKTMGPGARQDLLESQFDFWNWEKYKFLGQTLRKNLRDASDDEAKFQEAHEDLTANLPKEMVAKWEGEVTTWEMAPNGKANVVNPYDVGVEFVGQAEAMKELALEDEDRLKRGEVRYHQTSAAAFIAVCLDIRDKQQKLKAEVEERARNPTVRQVGKLTDQRNALRRQILNLEEVRAVYMPGLAQYLRDVGGGEDVVEEKAEDISVWLPSSIPPENRRSVCAPGIVDVEAKLQRGKAYDALDGLRHSLRLKSRMLLFKNANSWGQRESGRANETINQVAARVDGFAVWYRGCWKAYYSLLCQDGGEELPNLDTGDVRSYRDPATVHVGPGRRGTNELWEEGAPNDNQWKEATAETITGQHLIPLDRREWDHRSVYGTGETRKTLSWIWTHRGHKIGLEDGIDDGDLLRAEWCKSRARMKRAEEEVLMVKEERRRALEYLEWAVQRWDERKHTGETVKKALKEGRAAYAAEQAAIQRGLREKFLGLWGDSGQTEDADDEDDAEGFDGGEEDGMEEEGPIDDDDVYEL